MRVAACLSEIRAYQYTHGGTYTDPISGKPRQYDLRANLRIDDYSINLAVECKNLSSSSPLIICGTMRAEADAYHDIIDSRFGSFESKGRKMVGASSITLRTRGVSCFYPHGKFVGKSLLRAKLDRSLSAIPDSDIYDRWSQALSSSIELADLACKKAYLERKQHVYSTILPIVVIPDETLWIASYDLRGNLVAEPSEADECEFFVGRNVEITLDAQRQLITLHNFSFSHIHFFTLSGFKSFVSKLAINNNIVGVLFSDRAEEL